ncbi:MAG: metallophosphoesterase [Elusimicrobiota bacterium]|nr:MAG: metallophosphoesterase [Elusimicrobiota bacterium]
MKPRRPLSIALLTVCWAGLFWGFYLEPRREPVETRAEIVLSGWPRELEGVRIAAISDIHAGAPYVGADKLRGLVRRVNAAEADAIVLLGDYVIDSVVGGTFMTPEDLAEILADLKAPLGVYAVLGNHDWWLDGPRVRTALEARGIKVLENEGVSLKTNGRAFRLAGLADHLERSPNPEAALQGAAREEPAIALIHEPDYFPEIPERIALTLAGHTHGGQVRLPWIGAPVVPSAYGQRYARGLVKEGTRQLFVTSGVGTSIIPVRFGVPPEYAVLTLRAL